MPVSPSQILVYVCDKCGATDHWDRLNPNEFLPTGWLELKTSDRPQSLTFDKLECLLDYVQSPPPLGTVANAPSGPPTSTMEDN
jgi:hypothetical protein